MNSIQQLLSERVTAALTTAVGDGAAGADPLIRPAADARFGDYQCNCAMGLAKRLGRKPRDLAEAVVGALDVADLCMNVEIAGPGFINLTLSPTFLSTALSAIAADDPRLGMPPVVKPDVVGVDMSSPNLAKEMHVGHLRPTIIGDAVARILEFQGHAVHRINHIGDWGTQFGMLIQFLRETEPHVLDDPDSLRLGDLEAFYVAAKNRFDEDAHFADQARQAVVDLQSGEPTTRAIWKAFCTESLRHCHEIYDMLDITLEDRGESFYNDTLAGIVEDLTTRGVATESDGAICVFPEGFTGRDGEPQPLIIRKKNGGYLYATTDLAALRHRIEVLGATRLVYVVGNTQKSHFDLLFAALRMTGWLPSDRPVDLVHLPTGLLLNDEGKPFRTRDGGTVKLRELLDEAVVREKRFLEANEADADKARGYDEAQIDHMAVTIGLAAVKYFELSHNLSTDYRFDWDQMLALEGNTAPYMLYAYARICSIVAKAGVPRAEFAAAPITLDHPSEVALAKQILRLPEIIEQIGRELRPNYLTEYLFELSRAFSTFYDRHTGVRVADAEPRAVRHSRLRLCDLTGRALQLGLGLLGIRTLQQM